MQPKKTALYEVHKRYGAKIIEFAGFLMPVQYRSIMAEHRKVRTSVGIFDVSHMGEIEFWGHGNLEFLQKMTINDVSQLSVNQAQYSAMCYEDGGLVDDLLVYRFKDHYMMVVNAANTDKDYDWLKKHQTAGVDIRNVSDDITLLAVQGRNAQPTLQKLTGLELSQIKHYWFRKGILADTPMVISRTGYTGEDGFELYIRNDSSEKVWNAVMEAGEEFDIEPVGLGARDTLRLEMKYCLYGNDIDHTTNPLEAGLGWLTKLDKGDFIGRRTLLKIKEQGLYRKLIGFQIEGKGFPRHGYPILSDEQQIGKVTSGTFSPSLEVGIGMGYVRKEFSAVGTEIEILIRDRKVKARVVEPPFYRHSSIKK